MRRAPRTRRSANGVEGTDGASQLLAAFGDLLGRGPHCVVDATRHGLNLFVVLVGDSSKARKGTSWSQTGRPSTLWAATAGEEQEPEENHALEADRDELLAHEEGT